MTERGYLGEVLEELRRERGLSLRDLAAQAGLTKSYLSQLESGKQKNPSLEKLRGLAAALGVSITVVRDEPGYIRVWKDSPSCVSFVSVGSTPRRDAPPIAIIHESEAPGVWDEKETHYKPDWTSSPGDTIADILEERGLTPEDLAVRTGLSVEFVEELLKGRAVITSEVAAGLQRALGSTVKFWMAREFHYRKALAGKVAIGVDPGAGPDQQAVTVWKVKDDQWTEVDPSATLEPGDVMADWRARMAQMEASKSWNQLYQGASLPRDKENPNPKPDTFARTIHRARGDQLKLESHRYFSGQEDEPKLDSKKLLQEEVGQMHEDTARSMLKHLEEWKAIEAEMKRDPNLKVMFRRAPMYEAWKAGRADSPIDPNGGNLNPHERALALERRRFERAAAERTLADLQATDPLFKTVLPPPPWLLEAYKPLPRTDAPQPDSDSPAPLGEE